MSETSMTGRFVLPEEPPSVGRRLMGAVKNFFTEGAEGVLMGAAIGLLAGAGFALAAPLLAGVMGAAAAGAAATAAAPLTFAAVAATAVKFAAVSAVFGGAAHAVIGAFESYMHSGKPLESQHQSPAKTRETGKARGLAQELETGMEAPSMKYRKQIEQERQLAAQSTQSR